MNARMYDPKIARFLQEDTYTGQADYPMGLNLYTYCHNNPVTYHDPTGHKVKIRQWDDLAVSFAKRGYEITKSNMDLGNIIDNFKNAISTINFIKDIIFEEISIEDLKNMGLDMVFGDLAYVRDNFKIVTDKKKYSDEG